VRIPPFHRAAIETPTRNNMSSPLLRYVLLSRSLCRCSTSFDIRRRSGSLRPPRLVSRVATALGIHSTRANPQRSVRPLRPSFPRVSIPRDSARSSNAYQSSHLHSRAQRAIAPCPGINGPLLILPLHLAAQFIVRINAILRKPLPPPAAPRPNEKIHFTPPTRAAVNYRADGSGFNPASSTPRERRLRGKVGGRERLSGGGSANDVSRCKLFNCTYTRRHTSRVSLPRVSR